MERHFDGDRDAAIRWLHAHASESHVARLLAEEQGASNEIRCIEIPVYLDPENDPFFGEPASWQQRTKNIGKGRGRTSR